MKHLIFITILILFVSSIANAQSYEVISELKPIPKKFKKFSKKLPKSSYSIVDETKFDFESQIDFVVLPNNKTGIAVNVKTTYYDLIFEPFGEEGKLRAKMRIFGRVISEDKKMSGFFQDNLAFEMTQEDYEKSKNTPIIFRKVFALSKGKYKADIIVEDFASGNRGIKAIKFQIP